MRDQFVGDIGDFAKYGLLRTLICDGSAARRLGVVWYANEDARDSSHGEGVSYLEDNASSYRACDHDLYDSLRSVVRSGRRRIFTVEESGLLGVDIPFWSELTLGRSPQRTGWLAGALKRVEGCDLVFLDPDNGLRLESASGARSVSPEHAYKDELLTFVNSAVVAVVYHTPSRHRKGFTHDKQVEEICEDLAGTGPDHRTVFAARWRRHGARLFLIVCKPGRADAVRQVLLAMRHSPWGQHLTGHPTPHFTFSIPGNSVPLVAWGGRSS